MPSLKVYYYTNTGKVRKNNEDALLVQNEIVSEANFDSCKSLEIEAEKILLVVADGMGGHEKGEVAARIVLETIKEQLQTMNDGEDIKRAIHLAKEKLEEYIKEHPEAYGLGCALAGVLVSNSEEAFIFNVGDCRVYRFINNNLRRLSKDHSLVESLLSDGLITPEEVRTHPQRNVLTSAVMGDSYNHSLDIYVNSVDISLGGKFLICSDGLWDELEDEEINHLLSEESCCEKLVEKLTEKPLRDNVSFIVFEA